MSNFIASNTYDPTHVDTSAKFRPKTGTFPYDNEDEDFDFNEEESELVPNKILNKKYKELGRGSGDYMAGDSRSFGTYQAMRYNEAVSHRSGISPIAGLYKNLDGAPIGTGNAGQAFRTTGPRRRTGDERAFTKGNVKAFKKSSKPKFSILDFFDENSDDEDCKLLENFFLKNQCIFNF